MVATDDEQELIRLSRGGDPEAFGALVRAHQRMVHAVTYRMTGSLADAEDLAQEIFLRAFCQLDGFRGEAKFSSWLYRMAVNASLNWAKRERRRQKVHQEFGKQPADDNAPDNESLSRRVQEALMKLPPKQRAAVVLTAYEGQSHADAARTLGCSETTVSWRVFAARTKLRRLLKDLAKPVESPV